MDGRNVNGWLCDTRDGYPNQYMIRNLNDSPSFCNKISIVQDPHYMKFLKDTIAGHSFLIDYETVFSDERKMELTNKYITKGNALNLFQKKYNIGSGIIYWFLVIVKMIFRCLKTENIQ